MYKLKFTNRFKKSYKPMVKQGQKEICVERMLRFIKLR